VKRCRVEREAQLRRRIADSCCPSRSSFFVTGGGH
jgi:hypothetical protein